MSIAREDVVHVARLARLALSEEELEKFQEQLSRILEHAERVTSLDLEGVPPTPHAIPLTNVSRPDEPDECLDPEEALSQAPEAEGRQFRVPRVLE